VKPLHLKKEQVYDISVMQITDASNPKTPFARMKGMIFYTAAASFCAGLNVGPAIWKRYSYDYLLMAVFWGSIAVVRGFQAVREAKRLASPGV